MNISLGRSRIRMALVALAALAVGAAMLVPHLSTAQAATSDEASTLAFEANSEFDGADCDVSLPGSTPSSSLLPDPFTKADGTRITSKSQ